MHLSIVVLDSATKSAGDTAVVSYNTSTGAPSTTVRGKDDIGINIQVEKT